MCDSDYHAAHQNLYHITINVFFTAAIVLYCRMGTVEVNH